MTKITTKVELPETVTIPVSEYRSLKSDSQQFRMLRLVLRTSARWVDNYSVGTPAGDLCQAFARTATIFPALERALSEKKGPLPRARRVWDLALVGYHKELEANKHTLV